MHSAFKTSAGIKKTSTALRVEISVCSPDIWLLTGILYPVDEK
jgi:hypothetical protein